MVDEMEGWYIRSQCELIRDRCGHIEDLLESEDTERIRRVLEAIMVSTDKIEKDIDEGRPRELILKYPVDFEAKKSLAETRNADR